MAKYLIKNPSLDKYYKKTVLSFISWVASAFKTDGMDAIKEQFWCYEPMGSHTSRYGAICALWYEKSGDAFYKEEAFRFLNFASYMTYENGVRLLEVDNSDREGFIWTPLNKGGVLKISYQSFGELTDTEKEFGEQTEKAIAEKAITLVLRPLNTIF